MKKSFITLAVLVAIVPHLGFPQVWKDVFTTIAALLIIALVAIPRKEVVQRENGRESWFTENAPHQKAEEIFDHPPHDADKK